jgi:hypothetical protein
MVVEHPDFGRLFTTQAFYLIFSLIINELRLHFSSCSVIEDSAIQAHDKGSTTLYKNIRVKVLD